VTDAQRKTIFGMCRNIGMTEDDRRTLIYGLTGKESTNIGSCTVKYTIFYKHFIIHLLYGLHDSPMGTKK